MKIPDASLWKEILALIEVKASLKARLEALTTASYPRSLCGRDFSSLSSLASRY